MNEQALRPRLMVMAGPNGSGKTTITEQGLAHEWFKGCEYINPDLIARDQFGDWNAPEAVLKAAREADRRRTACLADRRDLAFETVFSSPDKVEFVRAAKQAGYFVRLFFVATDSPEINAARVARRMMQGGHEVPLSKIISRYAKSIAHCAAVACDVDRLYLYDNSADNAQARLVARGADGMLVRRREPVPAWAEAIVELLGKPTADRPSAGAT